ncbi:MAG: hypothetical protein IJS00_02765 [Paludibacteraceae bacterium]|nr:hypothetical protein [Paludibacteraceae bacterium]
MFKQLTLFCCLIAILLCADVYAATPNNTGKQQREAMRIMRHANKLQSKGQYLLALDSAAYALSVFPTSLAASTFLHEHWDETMAMAIRRLEKLNVEEDILQSRERERIYRRLVEINDWVSEVPLPLYGPNQKWAWQPDIQYWNGHWEKEKERLLRLEAESRAREEEEQNRE